MSARYEELVIESREKWRAWLAAHGATTPGIWVVTHKKNRNHLHVPYDDLVLEAIAAGWVDSRPRSVDAGRSGTRSGWRSSAQPAS